MQDTATDTLTVPDVPADADSLTAALLYAESGWYVLPVRHRTKDPGSVVGKHWQRKSSRDPEVITAWFAGTDYGIALHCGRSGAVVFDVDKPAKLPDVLRSALRRAPYQSTRPGTRGRGHYVFAMPTGHVFGNGTGQLGGAWGQVRGLNGVIIAAPTVHPDGGEYRWQRTGVVHTLPDVITDMLDEVSPADDAASDSVMASFIESHKTASRPELIDGWKAALRNRIAAGNSRHDSAVTVTVGAMKEARAGYLSARRTLKTLRAMFLEAVTEPPSSDKQGPSRTGREAASEWRGIVAWSVGQALAADLDDVRRRVAREMPDPVLVNGAELDAGSATGTSSTLGTIEGIEAGFWDARESLAMIYTGALARMCSPWAVLALCAARTLALVRPHVTLPPLIGGKGSLNWFAAIVATSAGGKGAASAVAAELVTDPVRQRNLGSGEGVLDAFVKPRDPETGEPAGLYESVMFVAHEIDGLSALAQRNGSTLMSILRGGFSGETIGFSYRANNRHLDAHTYRMTLVLSAQPARAGWLIGDQDGGTPQRFMWFPGQDDRIAMDRPHFPGALTLPREVDAWPYPVELTIPAEAEDLILTERVKAAHGEQDSLDGHALFAREKFAFALAVLDGRTQMSDEDWRLSGIAAQVSDHTRSAVAEAVQLARERDATEHGELQGISHAAANVSRAQAEWKRAHRIASWVFDKLKSAGPQGVSEGELKRDAYSPDRHSITSTLLSLEDQGLIARADRRKGERTDRWTLAKDEGPQ